MSFSRIQIFWVHQACNKYLFDVLHDNILYDSSIHPAFLPGKYIDYHNPLVPHIIKKKHKYLLEIPCSVFPILRIPISWWWMRNIGLWLTLYGTTSNLKRRNNVVLYFHPWEFTEIRERTVPLHITRYTGKKILRDLEKFIHYFQSKGYNFSTIKSLYIK